MLKYLVQTEKMNEMMELLFRVLDIRITFFDLLESELDHFNNKEMSPFCAYHRKHDESFRARCVACDHRHLRKAKESKQVHVYHCHAGLLEGIVPLYDRHKNYLGSIFYGQLRDQGGSHDKASKHDQRLLLKTPETTPEHLRDIGELLKRFGEYIIENEIIKYHNKPWAEHLERYIRERLGEKLTLANLARVIGKSPSFISQNFPRQFGATPKEYTSRLKMERAKMLLEDGASVRETALDLGFYDEFHFSKVFKKHFGASPINYKRQ